MHGSPGGIRKRKRARTTGPVWTGTGCPRPYLMVQMLLGDPWSGYDRQNELGEPKARTSQTAWGTGSRIAYGHTANPSVSAPICAGADGPSPSFSSQTRLGAPRGG
jgi:hypothetical protein